VFIGAIGRESARSPWPDQGTLASLGPDSHRLAIVRGTVGAVTVVDKTAARESSVDESVFGDVPAKIAQAVKEAVAEHRRQGRLIPVDRGNGVELIP
jgi:hypothetical protein